MISVSSFVGNAIRNALAALAEAEWRAEMEHRRGARNPVSKMRIKRGSSARRDVGFGSQTFSEKGRRRVQ